jgi:hypothetical protein
MLLEMVVIVATAGGLRGSLSTARFPGVTTVVGVVA